MSATEKTEKIKAEAIKSPTHAPTPVSQQILAWNEHIAKQRASAQVQFHAHMRSEIKEELLCDLCEIAWSRLLSFGMSKASVVYIR
jgi:hypothetical protein